MPDASLRPIRQFRRQAIGGRLEQAPVQKAAMIRHERPSKNSRFPVCQGTGTDEQGKAGKTCKATGELVPSP
jgi:hypothetical protein